MSRSKVVGAVVLAVVALIAFVSCTVEVNACLAGLCHHHHHQQQSSLLLETLPTECWGPNCHPLQTNYVSLAFFLLAFTVILAVIGSFIWLIQRAPAAQYVPMCPPAQQSYCVQAPVATSVQARMMW